MVDIGTAVAYLQLDTSAFNTGLANTQSALSSWQNGVSRGLTAIGGMLTGTGTALTTGLTVPLANAAKSAITFGAEFDKQMSAVKAVMQPTEAQFAQLRDTAIDWGEKTVYTATQAGEALYYMGLAGWDAEQSINGLGSVLNLAAAGQMDLGRASDVVTDSMTAMNLKAGEFTNGIENTAYYTSVLAAVMANSNTDVDMLGESFKYVASIAGQLGFTIEDLGLALGLAANAGVKSSQAGTSLRQALKQLISPTEKTATAMEKYGISLFDAQGQALPFREIMLQLQRTFGDLGVEVIDTNGDLKEGEAVMQEYANSLPISQQEKLKAVVDLFGTRAMPTMLAIIQQAGGEFDKLASAIDEAARTGTYASEMAHTQMDNLAGDWTRFTSALGTTKIMLKDLVDGYLRSFVQMLTELVNKFNALSAEQKMNVLRWGVIAAAIGPVMTIMGRLFTTIGQLIPLFSMLTRWFTNVHEAILLSKAGWTALAGEASNFGAAIGQMGARLNWIIAIIMAVITAIIDLWRNSEAFRGWVKDAFTALINIIKTVWGFLQEIFNVLGDVWMSIARAIEPLVAVLVKELSPALNAVLNLIKPIFQILTPIIQLLGGVLSLLIEIVQFITSPLALAIEFISSIVTNAVKILGNIFRAISDFVTPWLTQIVDFFKEGLTAIRDWFAWLKYQLVGDPIVIDMIEEIKAIFDAGLAFVKWLVEVFVNAVIDFFVWLKETGTQVVNGLVVGLKTIWNTFVEWFKTLWSTFRNWLSSAWYTLINAVENSWMSLVNWIRTVWDSFISNVMTVLRNVRDRIIEGVRSFVEILKQFLNNILETAKLIIEAIQRTAEEAWNRIVDGFRRAKEAIEQGILVIRQKFEELRELIRQKFEEIVENVRQKIEEIRARLEQLAQTLREKFEEIVHTIRQKFEEIMENIRELGRKFVEAWKNAFANVQSGIANVFNIIKQGFVKFGTYVFGVAKNVGNAFIKGLLGTGRTIKEFFTNFIRSAIETFLEKISVFKETGKLIITSLWEGIKDAWNTLVEWLKTAWEQLTNGSLFKTIGDWFSNIFDKIGTRMMVGVNGSHANGLAYVPYNGYVAELHKGERVLTAEQNERYSRNADGTTINFYSNEKIDEYTAAKELRRTIKDMELGLV